MFYVSKSSPMKPFTLLEVILAMIILAGAITTLSGERQRCLQDSRKIMERRIALRLASNHLDQFQALGPEGHELEIPQGYQLELINDTVNLSEFPTLELTDCRITVKTPSGEEVQLNRVLAP